MNEVSERLSFFAALYQVDEHPLAGMWLLYGTIVVLSVIVFKLGFAKRYAGFEGCGSLSLSRARAHRADFFRCVSAGRRRACCCRLDFDHLQNPSAPVQKSQSAKPQ